MTQCRDMDAPDATIGSLLDEERRLRGEMDELSGSRQRLAGLSLVPADLAGELAALDAADREALAGWARNGQGDAPVASGDARAALERKLAEARQRASHAVAASGEIETKVQEINAELLAVVSRINLAVEERIDQELAVDAAQATAAITVARTVVARLLGYKQFMSERGRQRLGENLDAGRAILSRLEKQAFQEIGDVAPDAREVDAAAAAWRARAAAARAGR